MSDLAEREPLVPPLLRDRSGVQRVTNIELFFDLVYVFAVTQLSHFDQSAGAAAEMIARSDDPGRLGRSAYHLIHPVMVAGIIVCAAADEKVLADPGAAASAASAWMILGGPALFLAGHATFKLVVSRAVSWLRLGRHRRAGPAGIGRPRHPRPGPGRLHRRPGHRRRGQRPPAVAARPAEPAP